MRGYSIVFRQTEEAPVLASRGKSGARVSGSGVFMLAKIPGFMDFADCRRHLFIDVRATVCVIVFRGPLHSGSLMGRAWPRVAHLHILQITRMWNIVFVMK